MRSSYTAPAMPVRTTDSDLAEAENARRTSASRLAESIEAGPHVRRTAEELRTLNRQNGFRELFVDSMRLRNHP